MADRQIVSRYSGAIVPAGQDNTNDLNAWRLHLEESLMAKLNRMTTDPNFLLEIEQKTEACFNELMVEGIEKLNQHAVNLSTTADQELTAFKKKAGDHLEERIQLATRSAHAEADLHASRLRNDTEHQMNKHLQRLIGEAKTEAREFAVAEVKSSLDHADQHIETKTDRAVVSMMKRFNTDAADRIGKLLKESFSSAQTTLQTFANDHITDIRRRTDDDVDRVFREVRAKEERAAVAMIKTHAVEEKRLISTAIEDKIDAVFSEARARQKKALALLDERADAHSTAVHESIQRQVKSMWLTSESEIKTSINQSVELLLQKHKQELVEYVDSRERQEARDIRIRHQVESTLKAFIMSEHKAHDERHKLLVSETVDRALVNLDKHIRTSVASANLPRDAAPHPIETCLEAVRQDVRDAVRDLDEKIAFVSRTVAASTTDKSVVDNETRTDVSSAIDAALVSIDSKIKAEVGRALSAVDMESAVRDRLEAVQRDVRDAVRDLDEKIALVSRTVAASTTDKSVVDNETRTDVSSAIDAALVSIDSKIKAEVGRALSTDGTVSDIADIVRQEIGTVMKWYAFPRAALHTW